MGSYYDDIDWDLVLADWPDDFTDWFLKEYSSFPSFMPYLN